VASRQPQPWRWLAACLAVIALLYVGVAVGGNWTPKLGLDLEGGASAVLKPVALKGHTVSASQRAQAVDVIRTRVNSLGVAEAEVSQVGDNIEVDIPGANKDQLGDLIGKTAQLRFRQVVAEEQVTPTTTTSATPTPTGTASGSATPTGTVTPSGAATGSAAPATSSAAAPTSSSAAAPTSTTAAPVVKASPTANGRVLSNALRAAAGTSSAAATSAAPTSSTPTSAAATTPASTATPVTTPAAAASGASASAGASGAIPASASPTATTPCTSINTTANESCETADVTKQIALLGDCSSTTLNKAEAAGYDDPAKPIAACDRNGGVIYVLAPAYMSGNEVKKAQSLYDSTQGYLVQLNFTGKGTTDFGKITTAVTSLTSPLNQVAIVLDGVVESAPNIEQAIDGGTAQITGGTGSPFTQADTDSLAQILNFGSLPISLQQLTVENVSPTLGSDQLRGGLLAGGIGLVLVLLYSLLYYRGLGLVTIASLGVSAGTTYASVTLLGGQIGYRLSLAGIAGFIVAVGITADSFVVYFERLRDEVREGRTLRSGAERAWVRARRTIISADTVSLLAAAILYWLSVGSVRGFAFTLGLSTITDLFVVFFFTKPLISLLARTKLYGGGGKFSGLGRQRVLGTSAPAVRPTPKEA
jgi:preprotein translocase subunit SecD